MGYYDYTVVRDTFEMLGRATPQPTASKERGDSRVARGQVSLNRPRCQGRRRSHRVRTRSMTGWANQVAILVKVGGGTAGPVSRVLAVIGPDAADAFPVDLGGALRLGCQFEQARFDLA